MRSKLKFKTISAFILLVTLLTYIGFRNYTSSNSNLTTIELSSLIVSNSIVSTEDPSSLVKDWHNYTQIEEEKNRKGPGEQGAGVRVSKSEAKEEEKIYKQNGYNGYVSDKISLQRSLRDIRHPDCMKKKYLRELPSVSVIIPFHQEHWSPLLRTVDSVIRRSPKGIIKEVLLVDDSSSKLFLQKQLDVYLKEHYPIARVVRTGTRQGLIRTRIIGAKEAKYDVLIFLDSHCEVNINWLPPLIDPIARNYKVVTCPFIDVISFDTFEYRAQDEGARGVFDWLFHYKRIPRLKSDASHPSDPFDSPVMAGGLFAISRRWFWELGGYDEGLDIWGGEQYELSFKLWQCGGRMIDTPCSRIGHVYRKYSPFPNNAKGNFVVRNFKRVALVWMDEYAEYLYLRSPYMRKEDPLDITKQMAIREKLHCKNFSWYMNEVAFDLIKNYPFIEPPPGAEGELRLLNKTLCMDFKFGLSGSPVVLSPCLSINPKHGGQQHLEMSWRGDLRTRSEEMCLDSSDHRPGGALLLFSCHGSHGNQFFKYNYKTHHLFSVSSELCVQGHPNSLSLTMEKCDATIIEQNWQFSKINTTILDSFFTAIAKKD